MFTVRSSQFTTNWLWIGTWLLLFVRFVQMWHRINKNEENITIFYSKRKRSSYFDIIIENHNGFEWAFNWLERQNSFWISSFHMNILSYRQFMKQKKPPTHDSIEITKMMIWRNIEFTEWKSPLAVMNIKIII